MREDVLVILNEREPLKAQMATELLSLLGQRGRLAERLPISNALPRIITERSPRVVILDFLLGDYGTALDVLSELKEKNTALRPNVIIWTDEASVSVAVSAMKLGASDYIELGNNSSIERILEAADRVIKESEFADPPTSRRPQRKREAGQLVGGNRAFLAGLSLLQGAIRRRHPIICLLGPRGSGRNELARFTHELRTQPGEFIELDSEYILEPLSTIVGGGPFGAPALLAAGATVCIDHIEFDTGELLELVREHRSQLFRELSETEPLLIVGTSEKEVALTWKRIVDAEIVEVPALSERKEDFLPLLQRFIAEAGKYVRSTKLTLTPALVSTIQEWNWPGNVRELRSVTTEVLTAPELCSLSEIPTEDRRTRTIQLDESDALEAFKQAKARWESYTHSSPALPSPLTARIAYDQAGGNLRIAAASLGTGIQQVRSALQAAGLVTIPASNSQRSFGT